MQMKIGLPSLVSLQLFKVFPEYFISVSIIYILIVVVIVTYNVYGLMVQKALSECMALILLMACYLMINDDVLIFTFFNGSVNDCVLTFDFFNKNEGTAVFNFTTFNNSIINDYLSFFSKFVICFFSAIYFFVVADSLKEQKLTSFEFLLIILFAVLGLILLCSSNDLLTAYLAIELSSLAFYILASFKKTSSYSAESGIKYFVIGAISSAFFLLGSSFIYGLTGSINFSDFFDLLECYMFYESFPWFDYKDYGDNALELIRAIWNYYNSTFLCFNYDFVELGLTLILFSLFIKLAVAPFHLWSLDVYEGSPTSATFFFAVITKLSIFVLLIRLCYVCFFRLQEIWQFYSLWVGVFSIFVGSFGGLKQRKLKTLLAYSSVSHMGYALIAFSTSTYLGIQMLLFYLIIYMLSGLCIWSIFLFLRLKQKNLNKYNKELSDLALLKKSNTTLAFALALTMFSIAGIPPMVGFIAKMNVFLSVVGISFYLAALVSILFSVVSTFYYIRIIKVLYFEKLIVGKLYYPINTKKTVLFSMLIFSIIFLFISPTLLYILNDKVALSIMV
jgi:NADH-quinone oxidoreductase subunit N